MANNDEMYQRAKNESEADFCNCLRLDNVHVINGCEIEFTDIVHNRCEYNIDDGNACISKKLDCAYHADVIAHGSWFDSHGNEKMTTVLFDVKDVEDKNISTGNFTLPKHEVDYFQKTTDVHYLVFRLNDGVSRKFNRYLAVRAQELCLKTVEFEDKGKFFNVPLNAIERCVKKFYA